MSSNLYIYVCFEKEELSFFIERKDESIRLDQSIWQIYIRHTKIKCQTLKYHDELRHKG